MIDTSDIDIFLGLDVGKGEHHATAVTPAGKKAFDRGLARRSSWRIARIRPV
ncbi:IS110 family transposase, partial [Streptomyces geysiriensis]|nr:IS110 family transposase [Streptomyces geysiriensis]